MLRKLLMVLICICTISVAVLTLASVGLRPHLFPHPSMDRVFAFAVLGTLFGLAFPRHKLTVLIWLVVAAILLEALQSISPGRDPRVSDAIAKIIGVMIGVGAAWLITRFFRVSRACRDHAA